MSKKKRFKKWLREQKGQKEQKEIKEEINEEKPKEKHEVKHKNPLINFYDKKYKVLMFFSFGLLFLSIIAIAFQIATTGDFINKGISIKGGLSVTIPYEVEINTNNFQDYLSTSLNKETNVRKLTKAGKQTGFIIDTEIEIQDSKSITNLISLVNQKLSLNLKPGDYTIEGMGSSLGASFFKETLVALAIAFIFMGLVVFLYFRMPIPSIAVILAALSDIITTLAIVNFLDMKISTAGIAAFLMLIGYSVDTDILLSTRVLKRKEGTIFERIMGAAKTGLMMSVTTISAVLIAFIFTQSEVIKQIMTILLIGLIVDPIYTWIQNAGILRWYLEKKGIK